MIPYRISARSFSIDTNLKNNSKRFRAEEWTLVRESLLELKTIIESGKSIPDRFYSSQSLKTQGIVDTFLRNYGVYHLHLVAQNSDHLLIVDVQDGVAKAIAIVSHRSFFVSGDAVANDKVQAALASRLKIPKRPIPHSPSGSALPSTATVEIKKTRTINYPPGHKLYKPPTKESATPSFRDLINLVESTTPSPAFDRWFAGSKVVDQSGNPLVVYHGTNQPIEQFSTSRLGTATGEGAGAKHGFFFTASEEEAGQYADNAGRRVIADIEKFEAEQQRLQNEVTRLERLAQKTGNWEPYEEAMSKWEDFEIAASREDPSTGRNIIAAYLAIRNPKVIDFGGGRIMSAGDFDETITAAKRAGHDGMILRNIADSPEGNLVSDHFVAFEPNQIKRVTATAFDPSSPNINEDDSADSLEND